MAESELTTLISKINALARKAKTTGLTESEKQEQTLLRNQYREIFRRNLKQQLDRIEVIDKNK